MATPADDMIAEAFRCFERWQAEHDPDGELDMLEAAQAYSTWAETNSVEKYLDCHQPPSTVSECNAS